MREIWVHNTVARMLDNDENNLVSGRYLTVANMQEVAYSLLPTDTASGAVASFPDGADGAPVERLTVSIEPAQAGSGDPSPDNVRPITGWSAARVTVNGETITHEFKDAQGNTLTVYGGEDDLVGGKLRVTHAYRLLTGAEEAWVYVEGYRGFRLSLTDAAILGIPSDDLTSNMFKGASRRGAGDAATPGLMLTYTGTSAADGRFVFFTTDITAATEWLAWLADNPVQLVYPLATPLEYDLTPNDLRTLLGDNTIFADCGDVEVTYKADIGLYIDMKLASRCATLTNRINNITVLDTVKATLSKRRAK